MTAADVSHPTHTVPQHEPPTIERDQRVVRHCPGCAVMSQIHPCYPNCGVADD